ATGAARPPGGGGGRKRKTTTRRAFLRNSWLGTMALGLAAFGGASIMYLWPNLTGGFGARVEVEEEDFILEEIRANNAPYEIPTGRTWLVEYDPALDPGGQYADLTNGAPLMALYWKCVHLGCRVPWCETSQWFECPCHGSRYNRWGEWQGGPAPRGLDRFGLEVRNGVVVVDTSTVVTGPPRTAAVLQQPPEGPSCL
ncbi:MAG: Rieske 2Fe-2S domain-containing protein, partial [Actinomycetota bacterium]|nr:Rieske 2Fe-2S domain-containing protein [Actinomycetota bacterium]